MNITKVDELPKSKFDKQRKVKESDEYMRLRDAIYRMRTGEVYKLGTYPSSVYKATTVERLSDELKEDRKRHNTDRYMVEQAIKEFPNMTIKIHMRSGTMYIRRLA